MTKITQIAKYAVLIFKCVAPVEGQKRDGYNMYVRLHCLNLQNQMIFKRDGKELEHQVSKELC